MNNTTVLQQLQSLLPGKRFEEIVKSYGADKYVKIFNCRHQLKTMLYAQAGGKDSLRDIITGLQAQANKLYHMGMPNVTRSNLSYANNNRNYRIYEELFYCFLNQCQDILPKHKFKFKNDLYSLDATTIDLCLSIFSWAKFRKKKGGIKVHALLNHRGSIPSFIVVTEAVKSDIKAAKEIEFPILSDSIIVADRGYVDFEWFDNLDEKEIYWVTRIKKNIEYRVIGQPKNFVGTGVLSDETIELTGDITRYKYSKFIRLIRYYDRGTDKTYEFITNNFKLASSTIAKIYKARWDIELFFKWIKQNLKIKTFLGTSKNAVLMQIWIAMIYYLIIAYIKYQTKYAYSILEFSRIIKETLLERTNLIHILSFDCRNVKKFIGMSPPLQLALF